MKWKPQGAMPAASLGVTLTLSRGLQEWGDEGQRMSNMTVTRREQWGNEQGHPEQSRLCFLEMP